jgi:tetratricopeptide (TPR) repeat protein
MSMEEVILMIDIALDYLRTEDTFRAMQYLERQADQAAALEAFNLLMKTLYWDERDLANVLIVGISGIHFGISTSEALAKSNPGRAVALKQATARIAYNLASYTWPGWEEAGVEISINDQQVGQMAARVNLRLLKELESDDITLARAYWMNGAHHLMLGEPDDALACFERSLRHADWADNRGETLLAQGFMILADIQSSQERPAGEKLLADLYERLGEVPGGEAFVEQIKAADMILGGS